MNPNKKYQKPETQVIYVETEGDVFVLSGQVPGQDKNPGDIGITNSYFNKSSQILKGSDE